MCVYIKRMIKGFLNSAVVSVSIFLESCLPALKSRVFRKIPSYLKKLTQVINSPNNEPTTSCCGTVGARFD